MPTHSAYHDPFEPHVPPLHVPNIERAVLALADLTVTCRRFHACLCLEASGWVRDLTLFDAPGDQPGDALDWAEYVVADDLEVCSVVLWSAGPEPLAVVHERDIAWFHEARELIGAAGADLVDWVRSDGDRFRSMAITCGTASPAWLAC